MKQTIIAFIRAVQEVCGAAIAPLLDFIDNRQVVRRAMLAIAVWQMTDVYFWAKRFAERPGMTGVELGAVILALTGPSTALLGAMYKMYDGSRRSDGTTA